MRSRSNLNIKLLLIAGFLMINFFVISTSAQVSQVWANRYNGTMNKNDYSSDIEVDNSGNVYVTGSGEESGTGTDVITAKYNSSGMLMWLTKYHEAPYEKGFDIVIDPLSPDNLYVVGVIESDGLILKYNSLGAFQWSRRITGGVTFKHAAVDNYGNLCAAGNNRIVKYSKFGTLIWTTYPGFETNCLILDASGNVFVTGTQAATYDIFTAKFSSATGSVLWSQRYVNPGIDAGKKLARDLSGNVYVTGVIHSGVYWNLILIKYSPSGSFAWAKTYDGIANEDVGIDVKIDGGGNIIVAGNTGYTATVRPDYLALKYDSYGRLLWSSQYSRPHNGIDNASSMDLDNLGNIYITGYTSDGLTPSMIEITTVKFNSGGTLQWDISYGAPLYTQNYPSKVLYKNGFIYVTGLSKSPTTLDDYITIKYSQTVSRPASVNEIPESFKLYDNYPNPFNPSTNIKFDIAKESNAKLVVYDILGKVIDEPLNEHREAGGYELVWDASKFSSGVYFYKLTAGEFTETKKMILTK